MVDMGRVWLARDAFLEGAGCFGGDFNAALPLWNHSQAKADAYSGTPSWQPTHEHRKGGRYRVLMRATIEADLSEAVIYDDAEGRIWVRPAAEFDDGRFTVLEVTDNG